MEFIGYFAAMVMGLSLGLIGGGGSILTVPILVYLFAQDPLGATTGSLFVVGATALVGAMNNARSKTIDLKTGFLFALPSFAGVFVSRHFILPNLPDVIIAKHGIALSKALLVMSVFAIIMVLASRAMIRSGDGSKPSEMTAKPAGYMTVGWNGFLVGVTTGFVGAGGGFLIIPALVLLLKLPMRIAVGTSLAIIAANSLFGFAISARADPLDWRVLTIVTGIGVAGIFVGQHLSTAINEKALKKGFGYFVLLIGTLILADQIMKLT